MKIPVWVDYSAEVEVDIGKDAILEAFTTTPEAGETWLTVLNRFALCLNALPDDMIQAFTPEQRHTIADFLMRHAGRFVSPVRLTHTDAREEDSP